jgi:hypothetical protein
LYLVPACYCMFVQNIINFFSTIIHTNDRQYNELVTREPNMNAVIYRASDMHFYLPVTSSPTTDRHFSITSDRRYQ